ncbi:MAG TPA: glycosyltransferase family 4 protein [Pseudolabrys sp.]|nr:glycosyltransferase family 4 protein [Pseudolabrys sp.]
MARKILYLVSEDWYFLSHRLPMARAAHAAGYEVHVATRVDSDGEAIAREGFTVHPIRWRRGSLNPFRFLAAVLETRRLYRALAPDLVHHVALVPSVVGSLASLGLAMPRLNALAGLGFVFTSKTAKALLARHIARPVLGWLLRRPKSAVLVQNPDDRAAMQSLGVPARQITLIPGSGVDVDVLTPLPEPPGPFTIGFVGRLLEDKGVQSLVRAHEILGERGVELRALLAGDPDPSNPASIAQDVLERWRLRANLVLLGHVDDVRTVWAQAHVAVLPSRREGLPKSLLEAAACGRALIATDVPGCREIAHQGVNGLLVPADDAQALADAIAVLMTDRALRARYGIAARDIVVREFSSARIGSEIVALYARLLATAPASPLAPQKV